MKYRLSNDGQQKVFSRMLVALSLWSAMTVQAYAQLGDTAAPHARGMAAVHDPARPAMKAEDDAQARFSEGVKLAKDGKVAQAIKVFSELARDYPDLAEPHNNLGVLYEKNGDFERARAALEQAVKKDPRYATAHENLGDLFSQMASLFYERALSLGSGNRVAHDNAATLSAIGGLPSRGRPVKLAELTAASPDADALEKLANDYARLAYRAYSRTRQIDPVATGISEKLSLLDKVIGERAVDAAPGVSQTKGTLVFSDDRQTAAQAMPPAAGSPSAFEPISRPATAPGKSNVVPRAAVAKSDSGVRDDLVDPLAMVNEWANAWSARDVTRYLSFYAPYFKTPRGQTSDTWKKLRAARISGKNNIKVTVDSPRLTVDGDVAIVKFRQSYVSDRFRDVTDKILVLTRRGTTWQILEERNGS
ncbi:MAG: tetratricopeptide repeat protein [Noviherbaspirillum sp.]|nr:tetratricopeptide repeat protein [Noviherbaspirillum sp.]